MSVHRLVEKTVKRLAWPTTCAAFVASAVAAGVLAASAPAASSILYVDRGAPNCSDTAAGTTTQPFCTIGAAASKVTAGQTVEVAPGTYSENVVVSRSGTSGAPITFAVAPGGTVTVTGKDHGFTLGSVSWVTVRGFNVTRTTDQGIDVSSASHITLSDNDVSYSGQRVSGKGAAGIRLSNVADSVIDDNSSHDNSDFGVEVISGSTRNSLSANRVFGNARGFERAAAGIRLYSSPANTVAGNVAHHNEDSGIESYTGSNNTLLHNNVTHDNGDHGIDNYFSKGQRVIANSVYDNVTAGINVEGSSPGATIANNISVDNGINSPRTRGNIRVDSKSTSGTKMNDDLVYLRTPDKLLVWGSTSYTSLVSFKSSTGQESRGLEAAPKWTSPADGNFHLTGGSPAIDSADSGASGQPSTDVEGASRFDDPSTANTGAGPRAYDDRGAYEYRSGAGPPAAALRVTPESGPVELDVTADASASTDGDDTPITSYRFDFGDGSPAVGPQAAPTASHTYTRAGTYTVTVTVTDSRGLSSTATSTVTVTENPPNAALTVSPSTGDPPLAVTADASASTGGGAPIDTYRFDFGDGTVIGPQATPTANHTFTAAGTYTVRATVTDTAGQSSVATSEVQVLGNMVGNPDFESSTSGWKVASGSSPAILLSQVSGGHSGLAAAKMANTGTTPATCTLNDSPNWVTTTRVGRYTASIWARSDVAGATLKLRVREYDTGGVLVAGATTLATLSTSWQQIAVPYTPGKPGASSLDLNAYVTDAAPGTCFYADDVFIGLG